MFFNMGGAEILVIALVALIAIGPEQLPSVMRKVGGFVGQARSITSGLRDEFMSGIDDLKDAADVETWTGSGSDDDPIVPRGYADGGGVGDAADDDVIDDKATAPAERRGGGQLGKADIPPPFSPSSPAARSAAGSASASAAASSSESSNGSSSSADTEADAEAASGVEPSSTEGEGEES